MQKTERSPLPPALFLRAMEDTKEEMEKIKQFIVKGINKPLYFFQYVHEHIPNHRHIVFHIMSHWKDNADPIKVHDFQTFLSVVANQAVQEWCNEKGINEPLTVKVRNPNTFPSLFAVYLNEIEILQFSLIENYYGIRTLKEENDLIKSHEEYCRTIYANIEDLQRKLVNDWDLYEHPLNYTKGWYDRIRTWFLLRTKKEKFVENMKKRIESKEKHIKDYRKEMDLAIERHPSILEQNRKKREVIELITPLFEDNGYRLETKESLLY